MIASGRVFVKAVGSKEKDPVVDGSAERPQKEGPKEAPLVGVDVHVQLIDYCAQITHTLRFRNDEDAPFEATYEFQLPKGCAISSFSADVGTRHLTGRIQEKQRAEEDYDDAVAAGFSTVLMETKEEDPNAFFVQLGNVATGEESFVESHESSSRPFS